MIKHLKYINGREQQRPQVERLQKLIRDVTQLRSKGMNTQANVMVMEIRKLEKELGCKTRWGETKAERVASVNDFKRSLKERLKK